MLFFDLFIVNITLFRKFANSTSFRRCQIFLIRLWTIGGQFQGYFSEHFFFKIHKSISGLLLKVSTAWMIGKIFTKLVFELFLGRIVEMSNFSSPCHFITRELKQLWLLSTNWSRLGKSWQKIILFWKKWSNSEKDSFYFDKTDIILTSDGSSKVVRIFGLQWSVRISSYIFQTESWTFCKVGFCKHFRLAN